MTEKYRSQCGVCFDDGTPDKHRCDRPPCHSGLHCTDEGLTFGHPGTRHEISYNLDKNDISGPTLKPDQLKAITDTIKGLEIRSYTIPEELRLNLTGKDLDTLVMIMERGWESCKDFAVERIEQRWGKGHSVPSA